MKLAGLTSVLVNDLVPTQKEKVAGVYQFGVREAIELEEGCSYREAHVLGVRLHNDLYATLAGSGTKQAPAISRVPAHNGGAPWIWRAGRAPRGRWHYTAWRPTRRGPARVYDYHDVAGG